MNYQKLVIFRPTINKTISQGWGENKACITRENRIVGINKGGCPVDTVPFYKSMGLLGHNGYDVAGLVGSDIYHAATFQGRWHTETDMDGGIGVDVISNEPLFFEGSIPLGLKSTAIEVEQDGVKGFIHHVKMRYWHLHVALGQEGKQVTCGTVIGLLGNTGASSGAHLHWSPKWCDKDGKSVWSNNGYAGAFDPTPYYNNSSTAQEHSDMLTKEAIPLSPVELQEMKSKLNLMQMMIVAVDKIIKLKVLV